MWRRHEEAEDVKGSRGYPRSEIDARIDLDDPCGWNTEGIGHGARVARHEGEQRLAPVTHPTGRRGNEGRAAEIKCRLFRIDGNRPGSAGPGQRRGNVGLIQVSTLNHQPVEPVGEPVVSAAVVRADPRNVAGLHGQEDHRLW